MDTKVETIKQLNIIDQRFFAPQQAYRHSISGPLLLKSLEGDTNPTTPQTKLKQKNHPHLQPYLILVFPIIGLCFYQPVKCCCPRKRPGEYCSDFPAATIV